MKKFFSLIAAVLFAGSMMAEEATMTAGTNGSACTVNDVAGIKCGTSKAGGDMTITVGAGATKLTFYAAAWKGVNDLSLNLAADGITISPASVSLTADDGISNNSPFTLAGLPENFKFEVDLTNVSAETVISVTSSAAKRFAVWGASYDAGGGVTPPVEQGCNWDEIAFLGNGSGNAAYTDRFKVCAGDPAPTSIVNIQAPDWAAEAGIYVTFPSAAFGAISLEDGQYAIDGAGMVLYASAFLYEAEKEVTIVCQEVTYTLTIKNANPETAPVVPITCAAVYSLEKNAEVALNDVVVTHVNGRNVWVKDESAAMLLYLTADATWAAGDVLSGVAGVVDIYKGLYEVKPSADQVAAIVATPGEAPAAEELAVIDEATDMNKYIVLKNVAVSGAFENNKLTMTVGENTYELYNKFNSNYAFDATKTYDITGIVSVYNTLQVLFINAEEASAPVEPLMKTIYCKMDKDWWKADGAAVGCFTWNDGGEPKVAWPGERMTPVEGEADLWSFELDINTYHMCIFTRVNGEGDVADWGAKTTDLTIPTDENDMFTITNADPTWGDPGCAGAWSKYEPAAPVEMTAIYDWAGEVGTTILGTTGVEISTVKIHTNTDEIPGIKFGSSYVYADGKYIAIKPAEGGFKAGDVVSVAAVFNNANTNNDKYAQIDLRAANGDTRIWLSDSASTINGRLVADEPIVQTYTLEADQDSLLLGRYGNTALFITLLKVERAGGETPVEPETIPTTAPAVPAQAEADVMAIYCNHYATNNANFGISGWAGGYQTLNLDGTMAAYWTGMTWECIIDPANTDAAHDFSAYENIHVDMWAPAAAKIKFTAEAVAGGNYKDGQVLDLVQGWNSFDIAIADWAGNYDFANLKCFALEQYQTPAGESFEGNPFAIANIYFWNAPVATDTYTVAGSSADLFGTAWDPTNVANDMALQEDGTYKWEKTEITLPEGEIAFKVCQNHAWTNCWPAENYSMPISEAGVYTITITYNPEGNVVAGDAVKTGDAVVDPVVSIAGSMNSWNASADLMTLAEDKQTASLTLNLTAATYEFKVVLNGGDWRSNAQEFTRENATAAEMTGNLDNMHLVADMDGDYVFTWTFATNTLVITYPTAGPEPLVKPTDAPVPTAAEDDVMAIYCNHYANNNANFGISGWAGGYQTLVLNEINVGYWTGMTWECIIDPAHTDDAHDFSAYKNLHVDLWAPLPAKIKFTAEAVAGGNYKDGQVIEMQQGWNSMDFVVAEWPGNYDFKNLKCFVFEQYQTLEGESFEGNPFAFANIYFHGKEGQGIDNTNVEMNAVKFIENGQLIILKNGVKYNVMGVIVR